MKTAPALAFALTAASALLPATSRAASLAAAPVVACIETAAKAYRVPSAIVLILLAIEDGRLGQVSPNGNGTVGIGPMQVNTIWVPVMARRWHASPLAAYAALRDVFCANVEAGTWILRQAIDDAHGDLWEGVGFYHSHDPGYKADYLRKALRQALRLQARTLHPASETYSTSGGS